MKPIRLTATNFRSYPELDVPLSELELATLCGENGAGKSSVLKAMLFGLFGPEPGLSQDDYIRTGQEEARVEFTFALNGGSYRVTRTRKSNGKTGKTTLELAKRNGSAAWEPITGDTIAQTQERINETLCLDQEGFLKSAWISQGDADAFTRAKPTERKGVLAGILGLEIWKRLQEAAKKRLRAIEDEIEKLRGKLEHVELQLEGKAGTAAALKEAREQAATYQYGIKQLEEKLEQLRLEEKRLAATKAQRDTIQQQRVAADKAVSEIADKLATLNSQAGGLKSLEASVQDLETSLARRDSINTELARLEENAKKWHENNQQRVELQAQYREAKATVNSAAGEQQAAEDHARQIIEKINHTSQKLAELDTGEVHHCPTCEQEIKDAALEATRSRYTRDLEDWKSEKQVVETNVQRLSGQHDALKESLAEIEAKGKALPTVEYDQGAHDGLKKELADLNGVEGKLAEAQGAAARLSEIEQEIRGLAGQQQEKERERARLEETLAGMMADLGRLDETIRAISETNGQLSEARTNHEAAAADVTRHQAELERLNKLEAESAEDRRRRNELQATAGTWRYLVDAFGKDGIPALIIDAAIPEVEDAANDILSRLGTGLEVKLETQKALKSSDRIAETLDVKIIEHGFERPYETYSGGEAYRVNVALRVALSKLLARRAGAHIETLILDEPEGLDEEGRGKLVELLQILSETFGTILLISHHEDLREVFPARIECRKGPEGSTAEVVMA